VAALAVCAASGTPNAASKARTAMNFFMIHLHCLLLASAEAPNGQCPADDLKMGGLALPDQYISGLFR
jgi:hypothetical protein